MDYYPDDLLTFLARLRAADPSPLDRSLIAGVKEALEELPTPITRSDKEVNDDGS